MLAYHYTKPSTLAAILDEGVILPISLRSPLGKIPVLKNLLSKAHKDLGVYCIRQCDWRGFASDTIIRERFTTLKSENGSLVRISCEIPDDAPVEVLDEGIMMHEIFPLATQKYNLFDCSKRQLMWRIPALACEALPLYRKFVDTRVPLAEYQDQFRLPVLFVQAPIPLAPPVMYEVIENCLDGL